MTNDLLIQKNWATVGAQLKLLEPAPLTEREFNAISCARRNMNDRSFRLVLPMIIAKFRKSASKEIFSWAQKIPSTQVAVYDTSGTFDISTKSYTDEILQQFATDVSIINNTLFGRNVGVGDIHIGKFTKQRSPTLHDDGSPTLNPTPVYLARIGSLPVQFISGKDQSENEALVRRAMLAVRTANIAIATPEISRALQAINMEMVERGILNDFPLGHLALGLAGGNQFNNTGTLHRSAKVPESGAHSAFLRFIAT